MGYYIDNITRIAMDMKRERTMKRWCRNRKYKDIYLWGEAVYPGDVENVFQMSRCDTLVNVSEDRGIYEEINQPEVFGYYRTSHEGWHMTLEETGKRIGPHTYYDYDKHIMMSAPVAVVTPKWEDLAEFLNLR